MKTKVLVVIIVVICVLVVGAIAVFASPHFKRQINDVFSTAPVSVNADEGLKIIKETFPNLCSDIKFRICSWNSDKSVQWLEYASKEADFNLNSSTKKVDILIMKNPDDNEDAGIEVAKAQELAQNIIAQYRPDIDLTVMKQTESKFVDYGMRKLFQFEWREFRDDVDVGNAIKVTLRPNGQLRSYNVSKRENINIDTKSGKLTGEQAIEAARNYLKPKISEAKFNVLQVKESKLAVYKDKVSWVIKLSSQPPGGDPIIYYYLVTIDAQNGDVLDYAGG